jgi:hypothetical protein
MKLHLSRWPSFVHAEIMAWRTDFREAPLPTALNFIGHVCFVVFPLLLLFDPSFRDGVVEKLLDVLPVIDR